MRVPSSTYDQPVAVFITTQTSAFAEARRESRRFQGLQTNVRRPLRGIEVKYDTYAVLRVLRADGVEVPLLDSSSSDVDPMDRGYSPNYSNFLIQQVVEQRMEKNQIIDTFGEDYVFFFGERPRMLQVRGVLLNTNDFDWKNEFWENYERHLRGTRLVEQNARLYLYYDDIVVEGYLVAASSTQTSQNPHHLPFDFRMFVTNYAVLSPVGDTRFQRRSFPAASDNPALPEDGLPAPSEAEQKAQAEKAARQGASGGLHSFLAATQNFYNDASFAVQNTLENIRNTFYGRQMVIPEGLGSQVVLQPIGNQARFDPAPTNQPIHTMNDEYPERGAQQVEYDTVELERVRDAQALRSPKELEARARQELQKRGVDVSRPDPNYLLLGRAAFAGLQTFGSFGIRQADGVLRELGGN